MIQQVEITLSPKSRGFHLVTSEVMRQLPKLPKTGIVNIFCKGNHFIVKVCEIIVFLTITDTSAQKSPRKCGGIAIILTIHSSLSKRVSLCQGRRRHWPSRC